MKQVPVFLFMLTIPCFGMLGQVPAKDVLITLTVDVQGILSLAAPDDVTIIPYCVLSDDHVGAGPNPKDYESTVHLGRKVKWKGKSINKGSVKILMVAINPGYPILFEDGYILKRRHWKMAGDIKNSASLYEVSIPYSIYFVIKKGLKMYGPYRLDPKLKANN